MTTESKYFSIWLALVIVLSVWHPAGQTLASEPDLFVDLDGDGFNDFDPDDDGDGIPDEFEYHRFFNSAPVKLQTSLMFSDVPTLRADVSPSSARERFIRRDFRVRDLREPRNDFEADFSDDLGLGGGGGGGGCAGGICF
jgi:hypothetical protein